MTDLDAYLRSLRSDGYQTRRTRRGHWRVFSPRGQLVATTGGTPSDHRQLANLRAHIRRAQVTQCHG